MEEIFDLGYTKKPGGYGIGLHIARGIIEEHGGTIDVSNDDDFGAKVNINIPI